MRPRRADGGDTLPPLRLGAALPDASLAVFFLGGLYLRRTAAISFEALVVYGSRLKGDATQR